MRVLKAAVIKKLVALTLSTGDKIVSLIRLNKRWGADGLVRIQLCNVTSPRTMLSAEHGIWNTLSPFGKARHIRGLILLNFAELAEAVPIDAFSCLPIYQRYPSGRVWPRTANSYTHSSCACLSRGIRLHQPGSKKEGVISKHNEWDVAVITRLCFPQVWHTLSLVMLASDADPLPRRLTHKNLYSASTISSSTIEQKEFAPGLLMRLFNGDSFTFHRPTGMLEIPSVAKWLR